MARIGYINKETHAARTLEIFNGHRDEFVRFACGKLSEGLSSGEARGCLVKEVKSDMENAIFRHLKHTGVVRGEYRHQYYCGFYRTVRREPQKSDVPSDLLDVETILPNFSELVDSMMVDAGKLRMVSEIERIKNEKS